MFDVKNATETLIKDIKEWFDKNGPTSTAILGISGGKDSSIAAALCVKALGVDRVIGVMLPDGEQKDISDSIKLCEFLGIKNFTINIHPALEESFNRLKELNIEITEQCRQNMPPRERTKMIRAICQCYNGRMINTCNWSEDFIGYYTIGGDSDGDVAPLGKLTKTEVVQIGHYLGLPKELIDKTPSDGLCGKTDEDNFGFTYEALDNYIRKGTSGNENIDKKINKRHKDNLFKFNLSKCPTLGLSIDF